MADDSTGPSWHSVNNTDNFDFAQQPPVHVPRAWERAPRPSHLARIKSRKVWKRPEARGKGDIGRHEIPAIDEERNPLRDVSSNTPRPVKRLRVKDGLATGGHNEGGGFANYFATLRDGVIGTPKRKLALPDIEKPNEKQADTDEAINPPQELAQSNWNQTVLPNIDIAEDLVTVPESPAQADVRNLLESGESPTVAFENEVDQISNEELSIRKDEAQHNMSELVDEDLQPTPEITENTGEIGSPKATVDIPRPEEEPAPSLAETLGNTGTDTKDTSEEVSLSQVKTPISAARQIHTKSMPLTGFESPQGMNSPQIGTTLLKRESLRSKGSPRKRGSAKKNASSQKSHGLKKRDTLQEREILQQFNAASSPTNPKDAAIPHESEHASPSKLFPRQSLEVQCDNQQVTASPGSWKDDSLPEPSTDTHIGAITVDQMISKDKDIGRAMEAIEVCGNPDDGPTDTGFNDAPISAEAKSNMDQANDFIARSEVQEAVQSAATVGENVDVPIRKTRSGARISDDTSMLKDFLNRAQAKKAAKNVPLLSAEVPNLQPSPIRRSPRKALEPQCGDIGSPQKKKKSTRGPSTPPRKGFVEENDSSDDQEAICEPASFRRSARTRLPAPSKTPLGAPTFIPVRRGEGSDQIVLQKSQAQEMAIVTRANTRRNKGQSKPPVLALQELPPESPVKLTSKERADYAKKVAWAEKLASFQESKDAPEEPEEQQRPKVRRMRGLGAVNGTPAKKSTAMAPSSNGTPAPKRRSKTR